MLQLADLHTHTRCSDGALTPEELLARAKQVGISVLSVTDHDSIDGVEEACRIGKSIGVNVLPGIEMTVTLNQREIHILGYCFDPSHFTLRSCLELFRDQRLQRAERMVKKLNNMNVPVKMETVLDCAGKAVVCRPHIAEALVNQKFVSSYSEVFQRYIGDWAPAYERMPEFPLEKAIEVIEDAGGLSFLAHPGCSINEKELLSIIKSGIDGIETIHPSHTTEKQRYYRGIVNEYYLLESGGSDFHGGMRGDDKNLGNHGISHQAVERIQQRLAQTLA